jgi:hypothetical protein
MGIRQDYVGLESPGPIYNPTAAKYKKKLKTESFTKDERFRENKT